MRWYAVHEGSIREVHPFSAPKRSACRTFVEAAGDGTVAYGDLRKDIGKPGGALQIFENEDKHRTILAIRVSERAEDMRAPRTEEEKEVVRLMKKKGGGSRKAAIPFSAGAVAAAATAAAATTVAGVLLKRRKKEKEKEEKKKEEKKEEEEGEKKEARGQPTFDIVEGVEKEVKEGEVEERTREANAANAAREALARDLESERERQREAVQQREAELAEVSGKVQQLERDLAQSKQGEKKELDRANKCGKDLDECTSKLARGSVNRAVEDRGRKAREKELTESRNRARKLWLEKEQQRRQAAERSMESKRELKRKDNKLQALSREHELISQELESAKRALLAKRAELAKCMENTDVLRTQAQAQAQQA